MGKIRLLLALSVVAAHCGPLWNFGLLGGKDAVQVFYIISGFYMSLVLNEKYVGKKGSYKLFITNRFLRLAPVYWAVLILTLSICCATFIASKGVNISLFKSYTQVYPNFLSLLYLTSTNLLIFGQDVALFLGINQGDGTLYFTPNFVESKPPVYSFLFIPQAWTLGLELTFYLIAPFILKRGPKLVAVLAISSLLLRLYLYNVAGLKGDPWSYRFFPTELFFFLLGYASYQIYRSLQQSHISVLKGRFAFYFLLLFTLLYSYLPETQLPFVPFTIKQTVYTIVFVHSLPIIFTYFKNDTFDNSIGELSYPVYLSHMTVSLLFGLTPFRVLNIGSPFTITLVTLLLSWLLVKYVAGPVERYRQARMK